MENFLSFFQEIFLGKESESQIGLAELKKKQAVITNPARRKSIFIHQKPQELKISDLIRKGSYQKL